MCVCVCVLYESMYVCGWVGKLIFIRQLGKLYNCLKRLFPIENIGTEFSFTMFRNGSNSNICLSGGNVYVEGDDFYDNRKEI